MNTQILGKDVQKDNISWVFSLFFQSIGNIFLPWLLSLPLGVPILSLPNTFTLFIWNILGKESDKCLK